jgi:hypothetical protein
MIILYSCIPRPHLGLKFSSIKFRSVPQIDKISRDCKIEDGLIVQEVYSVTSIAYLIMHIFVIGVNLIRYQKNLLLRDLELELVISLHLSMESAFLIQLR